jgi:galactokinase
VTPREGSLSAFAPGRVNLIGEHTDYNDGLALPFAVMEGVTVEVAPLPGRRIEAIASDLGEEDSFDVEHAPRGDGWRAYVRGIVAELVASGVEVAGARVSITGTIPLGAGLSSSAALEVALALALIARAGAGDPNRIELARLCSRVENKWAGAETGLLDQLASLYGQTDHAVRIDFRSLEVAPVPLELEGHRFVTLDSGEQHANAASGYNERRRECREACLRLGIESLREASLDEAERLPDPLSRRVRHVLVSNARVELAVSALAKRDFVRLGELLDASHASLRDDYEVSSCAVERTVKTLKEVGALGARIMGGGFGGHVLGLLPPGAHAPESAREVRPGAAARLLSPQR